MSSEVIVTLTGSVEDRGIAIDSVQATTDSMDIARNLDLLTPVKILAQTPTMIETEMNFLIHIELAAMFTTIILVGVEIMTQMNSSHLRCVALVVHLLVTESLVVEQKNALMIQHASMSNVCPPTLVMNAQRTLSVRATTCFALILFVQNLVRSVTLALVTKLAEEILFAKWKLAPNF